LQKVALTGTAIRLTNCKTSGSKQFGDNLSLFPRLFLDILGENNEALSQDLGLWKAIQTKDRPGAGRCSNRAIATFALLM
jgi:hypothetical protein